MIKAFIDTNIMLDYLIAERKGCNVANDLFAMITEDKIAAYISPISLVNVFCILRNQKTEQERKEIIESLLDLFDIADINADVMQQSLYISIVDYEDAMQYISATMVGADYIITNDDKFKTYDLPIPRIDGMEFMKCMRR